MTRLSEALEQHQLELFLTPANRWLARSVDGPDEVIDQWASQLAAWWRRSPTSIRECDACGEISLAGTSKSRKCHRGICGGTMVPLAPRFTKPRPKGRTRKSLQMQRDALGATPVPSSGVGGSPASDTDSQVRKEDS